MIHAPAFWDDAVAKTLQRRGRPHEAWLWRLMNLLRWPLLLALAGTGALLALALFLPPMLRSALPGAFDENANPVGWTATLLQLIPILALLSAVAAGLAGAAYTVAAGALAGLMGEALWAVGILLFSPLAFIYRRVKGDQIRESP